MSIFVRGSKVRVDSKIFQILLYRINHLIARKNMNENPQLVIFSFDHIGLTLNLEGRYENSSLLLVEEFIKRKLPFAKDKIALDVGANIGNHSIFFANKFKSVYSFEPSPVTYEVLKINCKFATECKNIVPLNVGLSDKGGSLPFYIDRSNIGSSHIIDVNNELINDAIKINVKALDEFDEFRNANVGLIKIDVEGHELNVLKGARNLISKNMPAILFEQHPSEIIEGTSPVIEYLRQIGYEFFTIKKNFYCGESLAGKIVSLILRSIFGERLDFVKVDSFRQNFYNMILAMPNSR